MRKITKKELIEYVEENGDMEKEHRKYSEFYVTVTYVFEEDDLRYFTDKGIDVKRFINTRVKLHGMWSDSYGCEWDDVEFYDVEYYEELVPEVVIPAHSVIKERCTKYIPEWD